MGLRGYKKDKFEQMREDAIERILQAARRLFANNGYAATTVQMIAKEAGLVPSGIYHYFAGKEDLLEAVLDREIAAMDRTIYIGIQEHFIGKNVNVFLDYMADTVCDNVERISLMCHLVRFRCVPEYCAGKLCLLRHFADIMREYIQDPQEVDQAYEILTDFVGFAVFYSVTRHRDIFYRQIGELKVKASQLALKSVIY